MDLKKYMYFESSSYVTSSLGQFFDNAWPKLQENSDVDNRYVLAHYFFSQMVNC